MKEVSVREARAQFARILDEVERGEEIQIHRHGRPVARLARTSAYGPAFPTRSDLREALPPMQTGAADTVRRMRDEERY